jgi:integrase
MRHSFATHALDAGVPAKVVSELLGHADIAITLGVYSRVSPLWSKARSRALRLWSGAEGRTRVELLPVGDALRGAGADG